MGNDNFDKYQKNFNAELGWKRPYDTKYGERPRGRDYKSDLIATFGDSFTYAATVKDNEAWQELLADKIGKNVYNFGNSAYGTDQSYLRFKSDYPKVKTRIVTLGLICENINRVVNVYRKFYIPMTSIPLTKPRYIPEKGLFRLASNPIKDKDDIVMLRKPEYVIGLGANDYWYNNNYYNYVKSFPFSRILLSSYFYTEIIYRLKNNFISSQSMLWEDNDASSIMFYIFDKFVEDVKAMGAEPVIMLFPTKEDVVYRIRYKRHLTGATKFIDYCKERQYNCFDGIDIFAREAKNHDEVDSYFQGHLSPLGNRLIARSFYDYLITHNLIQPDNIN